jgi:hypothetical protein
MKISFLMIFKEIIAVYTENHTKPVHILYAQNAELFIVNAGGTYIYFSFMV